MTDTLTDILAAVSTASSSSGGVERRSTSQPELKRKARERVASAAAAGTSPSKYRSDDLTWAFGSGDAALAELEALELLAENAQAQKAERDRRIRAGGRVRSVAEQILRAEDKQRADDRMAGAIAEARRRLGLAAGEDG